MTKSYVTTNMSNYPDNASTRSRNKKVSQSRWGFVFRIIVTVLIISYFAIRVQWAELIGQLVRANYSFLALSTFLFGVVYFLTTLRWWFLMQVQGIHLSFRVVLALTFIGHFFNSFLLGAVGGDIIKAVYLQKYAPNQKTHATLSIIMDRVLGLLILVCASLLVIPWQFQYLLRNDQINSVMFSLLIMLGFCGMIGLVLVVIPFHHVPANIRAIWHKVPHRHIVELVISGFRQHGNVLNMTLASLAIGIIMTAVLVAAGYYIGVGIGLKVTYLQMLVIMTVVICAISLPISIGGHGVREGIFVIMFSAFGVINIDRQLGGGQEAAILFSVLFFAIPLIWSFVGGLVYLSFRHDYSKALLYDKK